jgi:hypothetical protein
MVTMVTRVNEKLKIYLFFWGHFFYFFEYGKWRKAKTRRTGYPAVHELQGILA